MLLPHPSCRRVSGDEPPGRSYTIVVWLLVTFLRHRRPAGRGRPRPGRRRWPRPPARCPSARSSTRPAATRPAAALSTTMSRCGARARRPGPAGRRSALAAASAPRSSLGSASGSPSCGGIDLVLRTSPSRSSRTDDVVVVVSSSRHVVAVDDQHPLRAERRPARRSCARPAPSRPPR